jgi:DNA-binding NtrC family response regulator
MNPRASRPAEEPNPAGSVLLIDDEQALLEIYATILKPHFDITTANNAREAEAFLQKKTFKVIVADHTMPGETGISLLTRMQAIFPHTQRVLVTGNMTPEMERTASDANLLFAFLVKPISIAELVNVVKAAAHVHDASLAASK